MPTEVNKCIFRGSNSAILNFAARQWSPTLIKSAHSSFDTTLKGFVNQGRKERVNKKLFPFVKMVGKKQHGLLR